MLELLAVCIHFLETVCNVVKAVLLAPICNNRVKTSHEKHSLFFGRVSRPCPKTVTQTILFSEHRQIRCNYCDNLKTLQEQGSLWREPLGVTREHGHLPDVVQAQIEHGHPLQADAPASMRRTPVLEGVDVGLNGVNGDVVGLGSLH